MNSVIPIILCGGSGTRLWPLSRSGFPKQFLSLTGENTLFQQALLRSQSIANSSIRLQPALIVTNEEHRFLALDQLRELEQLGNSIEAQFLLEPVGKNTAPALTLAALSALEASPQDDPILLVTPADQTIEDQDTFVDAIRRAVLEASTGAIVVLGIHPVRAETGYGYIQRQGVPDAHGAYRVSQFTEKPNAALANDYLASGDYYWNGGIFVLKASVWLRAIQTFRPDIANACQKAWQQKTIDHTASHASGLSR